MKIKGKEKEEEKKKKRGTEGAEQNLNNQSSCVQYCDNIASFTRWYKQLKCSAGTPVCSPDREFHLNQWMLANRPEKKKSEKAAIFAKPVAEYRGLSQRHTSYR
ncbi:hypothetical protein CISG_01643 [Coccidioides immitis RMSCC 3703]|uniref:Uncharacterized protein n=1 Tax=Coccidioides immitis RMSCC 3703 TaxID=454286 RepID=A0A0J8R4I0_COCIT|nr:hypothetical protein CISG_01643 [Coccidioides immitis RMSCC 3703]